MRMIHLDSFWIGGGEMTDDELVVATTRDELVIMAGAINEALEAIEEWEFDSRLGVTSARARELRDRLKEVVKVADRPDLQ